MVRGLAALVLTDAGPAPAVRSLGESRAAAGSMRPSGRFPGMVESTMHLALDRLTADSAAEVALRQNPDLLKLTVSVRGRVPDLGDLMARATTLGGAARVEPVAGELDFRVQVKDRP